MSRDDGFAVMDLSTDYANDAKWRKLHRRCPGLVPVAFVVYTATMTESWKAGHRMSAEEAWPTYLPTDEAVVPELRAVGFLDRRAMIPVKVWRDWFEKARARRDANRDRWRRYNSQRDAGTTSQPRGNDAGTATSVPTVPSVPTGGSTRPSILTTPGRQRLVEPVRTA